MVLCGVLSSFCLFLFCVYDVLSVVVPVHIQVVDYPVVDFLAADLQWSMEFLVDFIGWNLKLDVYMEDLTRMVSVLGGVLDWEVVVEMVNGLV